MNIKIVNGLISICAIYVDDMLIFSNADKLMSLNELKTNLQKYFKMRDLSPASNSIGLSITGDVNNGNQECYINEVFNLHMLTRN